MLCTYSIFFLCPSIGIIHLRTKKNLSKNCFNISLHFFSSHNKLHREKQKKTLKNIQKKISLHHSFYLNREKAKKKSIANA